MPGRNAKKKMGGRQVRKLIFYVKNVKWKERRKELGRGKVLLTRQLT